MVWILTYFKKNDYFLSFLKTFYIYVIICCMKDYLNLVVFGNNIKSYLIFLAIFIGLYLLFRFFRLVVIDRIKIFSEKTVNDFDDFVIEAIEGISKFFYWFVAFYFASKFIFISEKFHLYLGKIFLLFITYELIVILNKFIDY